MSFHKFTEQEVQALFKKFDTNNDTVIDKDEFKSLLKDVLGKEQSQADVDKIFAEVDENHDGRISYGELKDAFLKK